MNTKAKKPNELNTKLTTGTNHPRHTTSITQSGRVK